MNRQQRRANGIKGKVKTYTLTEDQIRKLKEDAISDVLALLFTLPCKVLKDYFWQKSYKTKIPDFAEHLVEYYQEWEDGNIDTTKLNDELMEYAGFKFQRNRTGGE